MSLINWLSACVITSMKEDVLAVCWSRAFMPKEEKTSAMIIEKQLLLSLRELCINRCPHLFVNLLICLCFSNIYDRSISWILVSILFWRNKQVSKIMLEQVVFLLMINLSATSTVLKYHHFYTQNVKQLNCFRH